MKNQRDRLFRHILVITLLLFFPIKALAGEFSVTPIRMDFDRDVKTSVVAIISEGEKVNLQMKAFEWTQDSEGKDVYTETSDLIFFPKIMTLSKGEKKTLRAGIESPPAAREKTYRLFVEEIPAPKKAEGVNVSITLRFGIPVFSKPLKEEAGAEIEKIEFSKGVIGVIVKNTGNVHLVINSIEVKGKNVKGTEMFSQELSGWYLLSGVTRRHAATIPAGVCRDLSKLAIEVKTDRINLKKDFDVKSGMCGP